MLTGSRAVHLSELEPEEEDEEEQYKVSRESVPQLLLD